MSYPELDLIDPDIVRQWAQNTLEEWLDGAVISLDDGERETFYFRAAYRADGTWWFGRSSTAFYGKVFRIHVTVEEE